MFLYFCKYFENKNLVERVLHWRNKQVLNAHFISIVLNITQAHAEVKNFPAEPINPLVSNSDGTYLVGGGISGDIYLWEVNICILLCIVWLCVLLYKN